MASMLYWSAAWPAAAALAKIKRYENRILARRQKALRELDGCPRRQANHKELQNEPHARNGSEKRQNEPNLNLENATG
jgi:hypothetical protein